MCFTCTVTAALIPKLDGMVVYDTDLNITWLTRSNLALTNTFDVNNIRSDGAMQWNTAKNWIFAMNAANYLGYNNWRLPSPINLSGIHRYAPCYTSYNCTEIELGHLFYIELGGTAGHSIGEPNYHNENLDLFSFLGVSLWEDESPSGNNWRFYNDVGMQYGGGLGSGYNYTLAVRDGDVATVPVPSTIWLFLSGFIILIIFNGVSRNSGTSLIAPNKKSKIHESPVLFPCPPASQEANASH